MGEHLPCKQGVESSNLFISIWFVKTKKSNLHLENCTSKKSRIDLEINLFKKMTSIKKRNRLGETVTLDRNTPREPKDWSRQKERKVDALALRADERRDKLRKASGRSKYPESRRYLNGETYLSKPQVSLSQSIT